MDPPVHMANRQKAKTKVKKTVNKKQSSWRKAPITERARRMEGSRKKKSQGRQKKQEKQGAVRIKASTNPPRADLIQKIRKKVEEEKARVESRRVEVEIKAKKTELEDGSLQKQSLHYHRYHGKSGHQRSSRVMLEQRWKAKVELAKTRNKIEERKPDEDEKDFARRDFKECKANASIIRGTKYKKKKPKTFIKGEVPKVQGDRHERSELHGYNAYKASAKDKGVSQAIARLLQAKPRSKSQV